MADAKQPQLGERPDAWGKGRWVTPEEYASLTPLTLSYIRHLCSKTCEKWRCTSRFDDRDIKRFSKSKVLIWYMPRNPTTGENYPRTVERPDDSSKMERRPHRGAPSAGNGTP